MVSIWTNIKQPYEWDGIKYYIHFKNHISGFLIFISLATSLTTYTIVLLMCTLPLVCTMHTIYMCMQVFYVVFVHSTSITSSISMVRRQRFLHIEQLKMCLRQKLEIAYLFPIKRQFISKEDVTIETMKGPLICVWCMCTFLFSTFVFDSSVCTA